MDYISFPNLFGGIKLNISPDITITDSFSLKWYGVLICLGYIICAILGLRACEKYGVDKDDLIDYILISIPAAVVGARLYYVIFRWDYYSQHPSDIIKVWEGGLAIYGGVIMVTLALILLTYLKNKTRAKKALKEGKEYTKLNPLTVIDFGIPYIALGQAIGRWGNFFNQEAYGAATSPDYFLGMTGSRIVKEMGDNLVHPTFLYESIWCFIAFAVMMIIRKKFRKHGEMVCWYCILYGAERAIVEGLRTDSLYIGSTGIRVSQVLSAVLVAVGIVVLLLIHFKSKKKETEEEVTGEEDSITRLKESMMEEETSEEKAAEKPSYDTEEKTEEEASEEEKSSEE